MQVKQIIVALGLVISSAAVSATTVNCEQTDGHWSITTNDESHAKELIKRCLDGPTGVGVTLTHDSVARATSNINNELNFGPGDKPKPKPPKPVPCFGPGDDKPKPGPQPCIPESLF